MAVLSTTHSRAEIIERRDFSADLWAVRMKPEARFNFVPGQYATFGVMENGKMIERPYSIVSSPYEETLEFFFELVPHGELTPRLYKLQVGDSVLMRKVPKGRFILDVKSGHKRHYLVSTVTGLAPFVSMARAFRKDWLEGRFREGFELFALQGASRSWELGYREEMEAYAAELPWLTYVPAISRPWEDKDWKGEVGRCEDILRKYSDQFGLGPEETTGYLCGHPEMIEKAKGILQRRGFAKESLREELYWVQK
ncbi:MAG: FAD-binding oxidoreductase [Candidatus Acidiferrales bacterium]